MNYFFSPFKKNSEHFSNQAEKALFALNTIVNINVTYLTLHVSFKMFDVHINPILQYGAEIWCNRKQIDIMEQLHRFAHENWCTWVKNILTTTNLHIW